jgi:hypothetical protein
MFQSLAVASDEATQRKDGGAKINWSEYNLERAASCITLENVYERVVCQIKWFE